MRRDDLKELDYITPIENVASILRYGILSHARVARLPHQSVAMPEVQTRRSQILLPTGRHLHDYVNLYFHARNPMMYKRKDDHEALCVLIISTDVLDLVGAIITDRNAAANPRFMRSPQGLAALDRGKVFAEDWRHPGNPSAYFDHKAVKCAEALIPDHVDSRYVIGVYTSCKKSASELQRLAPALPVRIVVDSHLFFNGGGVR
jgi:hypothetical protein